MAVKPRKEMKAAAKAENSAEKKNHQDGQEASEYAMLSFPNLIYPQFPENSPGWIDPVTDKKEFKQDLQKANAGDVDAMFRTGIRYFVEIGTPHDVKKAALWMSRAAEKGHINAQYFAGVLYWNRLGGKRMNDGMFWLKKQGKMAIRLSSASLALFITSRPGLQLAQTKVRGCSVSPAPSARRCNSPADTT